MRKSMASNFTGDNRTVARRWDCRSTCRRFDLSECHSEARL